MKKLITLLSLLTGLTANAQLSNTTNQFIPKENYAINGGFENGKANWTASAGGIFTITSTASNVARGGFAGSIDFSASAQTVSLGARAIPSGLYGQNCLAEAKLKGFDSNVTLEVYDGTNVIASQALSAYSTFNLVSIPFICPSSGNFLVRLKSSADAAIGYIDDVYLGDNYRIGTVAQATLVGKVIWPGTASCFWDSTATTLSGFSADSDCTLPAGSNVYGSASAPATKIPAIRFANGLPPGNYRIVADGDFGTTGGTDPAHWRFNGGSITTPSVMTYASGISNRMPQIAGEFKLDTAIGDTTIEIQAADAGGNTKRIHIGDSIGGVIPSLVISVYRYPSTSETVYAPVMKPALGYVEFNPSSGSYSTASSTFSIPSNASWGSARSNKGVCTTAASANDISCKIPKLPQGEYLVEVNVPRFRADTGGAACQLVVSDGTTNKGPSTTDTNLSGGSPASGNAVRGIFSYSSEQTDIVFSAKVSNQNATGNCTIEGGPYSFSGYGITLSVIPLTQSLPMPQIVNSLQTSYSGQMRVIGAHFGQASINTSCTSSPCGVFKDHGNNISSVTRSATGAYSFSFNASTFSDTPVCTVNTQSFQMRLNAPSSTGFSINTIDLTNADVDTYGSFICIGPK